MEPVEPLISFVLFAKAYPKVSVIEVLNELVLLVVVLDRGQVATPVLTKVLGFGEIT